MCSVDLESWVQRSCDKECVGRFKIQKANILCPVNECCSVIPDTAIARHISEGVFATYITTVRQTLELAIREESQHILNKELEQLRKDFAAGQEQRISQVLLEEQLRNSMPDARQCPSCGFGPIDPGFGCEDMLTHDGQLVENLVLGHDGKRLAPNLTHISNACPKCGARPEFKDEWPPWNGKLPDPSALTAGDRPLTGESSVTGDCRSRLPASDDPIFESGRTRARPPLVYLGARSSQEGYFPALDYEGTAWQLQACILPQRRWGNSRRLRSPSPRGASWRSGRSTTPPRPSYRQPAPPAHRPRGAPPPRGGRWSPAVRSPPRSPRGRRDRSPVRRCMPWARREELGSPGRWPDWRQEDWRLARLPGQRGAEPSPPSAAAVARMNRARRVEPIRDRSGPGSGSRGFGAARAGGRGPQGRSGAYMRVP